MDTCLNCNKPITQPPRGGRRRKFCSRKCQRKLAYQPKEPITYLLICEECGDMFEGKHKDAMYCPTKRCQSKAYWRKYKKEREIYYNVCEQCNTFFETPNKDTRFCSTACVGEFQREQAFDRRHYDLPPNIQHSRRARREWRRRKRIREQWVEDVKIEVLLERDKGICQLCKQPVRLDVPYTHPLAPTRDHIIPLNKGGEHSYANCQLACRDCNTIKNDRIEVNLVDKTKQKRKSTSRTFTIKRRNQRTYRS